MTGVVTMEAREYRVRVATEGAETVEGNVEFVLDLGILEDAPIASGIEVRPLKGITEMRAFTVSGVDVDHFVTTSYTKDERWSAIGRLTDCQFRTVGDYGEDAWRTYATGICSSFGQETPGKFEIEISDLSWRSRKGKLFEHNDTCQLWPAGIRYPWRGAPAALKALGGAVRIPETGIVSIGMLAGGDVSSQRGIMPTEKLIEFVRADAYPEEEIIQGNNFPPRGNYKTVRINYDGVDYEPLDLTLSLEDPVVFGENSLNRTVVINVTVAVPIEVELPEEAEAFIWAPTHEPTADFPFHGGVDSATHPWGNAGGWIHLADVARRFCQMLGQDYNEAQLAEKEADLSFPAIAFEVTSLVEDPEKWLADEILGGNDCYLGRDLEGKRILVDMRPPRFVPDGLPILTPDNAKNHKWRLVGDDARNQVLFRELVLTTAFEARRRDSVLADAVIGVRVDYGIKENARLDGLVAREILSDPPYDGDTQDTQGVRPLILNQRASSRLVSPDGGIFTSLLFRNQARQKLIASGRGLPFEDVKDFLATAYLNTYQDGPLRGSIDVDASLAENMQEGGYFWIDLTRFAIPSPGRLGAGIPGGAGPVVPGEELPELDPAPTLGTPVLLADLRIEVPVASVPAGQTLRVEYGTTVNAVTPPAPGSQVWLSAAPLLTGAGSTFVPSRPRGSYVWIRGSLEEGGIRISDYSTPVVVEVPSWPDFEMVDLVPLSGGSYAVVWQPGALTFGVRLMWKIHDPDVHPTYDQTADVEASVGSYVISGVPIDQRLTVQIQAYSGWNDSPGEVSGDLGETVVLARTRKETLGDATGANVLPIDLSSDAEVENVLARKHGGTGNNWDNLSGQDGKLVGVSSGAFALVDVDGGSP